MGTLTPPKALAIDAKVIGQQMLDCFPDSNEWKLEFTLNGTPTIMKPGFQITYQWENMFQCVVISSKYRFVGQGIDARYALRGALGAMLEFRDELIQHIAAAT